MRKLEVKIRQFIWAFNKCFLPTTYDKVLYNGNMYFIKSSLCGENIWDLFELNRKTAVYSRIKGIDLKVIHSLKRFILVFKQHMFFQKTNWEKIDCMNPLGTRLSYINSENIFFKNNTPKNE